MSPITLLMVLLVGSTVVLCKKKDPVCVEPLDGVAAYPCESRPSREPLSLQYSKVQSRFHSPSSHISIFRSVSKPAPMFQGISVMNGEFAEISLSDFKNKYLVLLFYPLDL